MARRSGPLAGLALLTLALVMPSTASSAVFHVENSRGVSQSHVKILDGMTLLGFTDAYGYASLPGVAPGQRLRFTRDYGTVGGCAAPEGPWGVEQDVSSHGGVQPVMLPALPGSSHQPSLDTEERWLLRRLNQERRRVKARPVTASSVLNQTADFYAGHLTSNGLMGHCTLSSPQVRAWDLGFPASGVGESVGRADTADEVLERWLGSPPHRATILLSEARSVGIARHGRTWVAMPGPRCLPDRCGMTDDRGGDQRSSRRGAGHTRSKPWLRIEHPERKGGVFTVEADIRRGDGVLRMVALSGNRRPRVRWISRNGSYRFATRLSRGRWRLEVHFLGRGRWPDTHRVRHINVR